MKTYKLRSWPDLPPVFHRTGFTRALNSLSHQFITESELQHACNLCTSDVRQLLRHLAAIDALQCCDMPELDAPSGGMRRLWPLGMIWRRAA